MIDRLANRSSYVDNGFNGGGIEVVPPVGVAKIKASMVAERNRNRNRIEESPERKRRRRVDLACERVSFRQVSRAVMEMLEQILKEVAGEVG